MSKFRISSSRITRATNAARMLSTRALMVTALLMCTVSRMHGQIVVGTLKDSSTGLPVPGALVSATPVPAGPVATTLSSQSGDYVLRLSQPGTYEVSVRRIGLRPSTPAVVTVGSGERVQLDIALERIVVTLEAVGVRERSVCGERVGGTSASRQLLSEFLSALQSLAASAKQGALSARVTNYVQYLDPRTQIVQAETAQVAQGAYRTPFTSATAADLAANGFSRVLPGGEVLFLAPDPAVLASPVFVGRHCFKAVPLPDEPAIAGLLIEPAPGIRSPDIEGIARFDMRSLELRSLTFRYVNAPTEAGTVRTTGFVEFARTSAGTWWVNAWHIMAPIYKTQRGSRRAVGGKSADVIAFHRGGGFVETEGLPVRSASVHLSYPGAVSNDSSIAVLAGTEHVARQESDGSFLLNSVTPGRYRVVVTRPTQAGVRGALAIDTTSAQAGERTDITLALKDEVYGSRDALCGSGGRDETRGAIAVRLLDATGRRTRGEYEVHLIGERQTNMSTAGYTLRSSRKPIQTDPSGTAWLCDREENEEFALIDVTANSRTPLPLGKIRPRELLVRHLMLPQTAQQH